MTATKFRVVEMYLLVVLTLNMYLLVVVRQIRQLILIVSLLPFFNTEDGK